MSSILQNYVLCGITLHSLSGFEQCLLNFKFVQIFPDIWNTARVTPNFILGAQSDLDNYRPISVLSRKYLERKREINYLTF